MLLFNLLNLWRLNMVVSKKVASSDHISAVSLIVGWCLFACSMNFWTTSLIECEKCADEDKYPNIRKSQVLSQK